LPRIKIYHTTGRKAVKRDAAIVPIPSPNVAHSHPSFLLLVNPKTLSSCQILLPSRGHTRLQRRQNSKYLEISGKLGAVAPKKPSQARYQYQSLSDPEAMRLLAI
jgi:hypothetical protein